jgi:hypothetical protein
MLETTTASDSPEIDQMTETLIEITAGSHAMVVANAALRVLVFALLALAQGWEDVRVVGEREVLVVVAINGQLYLLPEHRPAKFERIDHDGLHEAGYGPDDFE